MLTIKCISTQKSLYFTQVILDIVSLLLYHCIKIISAIPKHLFNVKDQVYDSDMIYCSKDIS